MAGAGYGWPPFIIVEQQGGLNSMGEAAASLSSRSDLGHGPTLQYRVAPTWQQLESLRKEAVRARLDEIHARQAYERFHPGKARFFRAVIVAVPAWLARVLLVVGLAEREGE